MKRDHPNYSRISAYRWQVDNVMLTDANDFAIVSGVFSLARSLGLSVVAEGVETEAQASLLLRLRCEHAQGFVFAKPMEPDELCKWIGPIVSAKMGFDN